MSDYWYDYDVDAKYTDSYNPASPRVPNPNLDRDAFLKLLVTQMQYQDPLNPMDNSQMLSQMAQFSALEQMNNVSNTTLQSMAFSMIGKTVEGTIDNEGGGTSPVLGVVSSILVQRGKTYLRVGESLLEASRITNVYTDTVSNINNNVANSQSFDLIGKVIQAITLNGDLEPAGFVEGKVDSVKFSGAGGTILVVGDKEVFPSEVVSVGKENMLIGKEIDIEVPKPDEDGAVEWAKRKVKEVIIRNEKAYLKLDGVAAEIEVEKINYVTDALTYVGKEMTHLGTTGVVEGVVIREGVPHFRLEGFEVSYKLYKDIFDEE